ncbi:MAG TPA: DNA helicase Rep [Gammaproteobacteria bacterium]|nr:DNA helicase Rep [Gammaproteobacteria bacterium]
MPGLNPRQRAAVRYVDGPLLVLAGAGSGKTRVITHKIAYLIRECGLAARHITAVTFTNKAAREMKERAGALLQGRDGRGLTVSTFHTLGLNILRREHRHLGYKAGFSVFDAQDSAQLMAELLRGTPTAFDPKALAQRISAWKNDLVAPEAALSTAADDFEQAAARLYATYQRHLKAYNAFDFDDLILKPVELLTHHEPARDHWRDRIRHLLVDEYQDTNGAQYRLVRLLVEMRGQLTAVGDDDQSIYAWRGARPENLARLQADFPSLKVVKLEQNYRSMGCILKSANQLIGHNSHVFEKRLWSELGHGDPLRALSCRDPDHEAERVASEILHRRFTHGTPWREFAILYRGNHQSRPFERALREHGIPYQLTGGTSFFEHAEVKDLLAYLRLLVNEDDDRALLRIVNTPRREIGANTLEKLGAYAQERGVSLLGACFELGLAQRLASRPHKRLLEFAEWTVGLADRARRGDPLSAVRAVIDETGYAAWIQDTASDPRQAERRLQNVEDLVSWLQRMAEQETGEPGLADLVGRLSLMGILDRNRDQADNDAVRMMTLHGAKGLEFPHVFLVGVEEEILPHRTSIQDENLEEERRLAYVGITRAQKTLTFTFCARRKRAGEWQSCEPSRFLSELSTDDLTWEGGKAQADPEKRQERGQAHLANLRSLLS